MNKRKALTIGLMLIALFGMLYLATGKPAQAAMRAQGENAPQLGALLSSAPWEFQTVEEGHLFDRWSNRAIAIDSNGNLHFAYGWGYLYYYDGESIQVVDKSTDGVGKYASLALDGSEYPHIAYYDVDNEALKYAYYDGEQWHIETVDSDPEGDVGEYASLALDESGNPHIAYYDHDNEVLKYAYYDGEQWHIEIVDNAGDVGEEASLALDASGHPHISYYDDNNRDLKYAYYDGSQWHIETVDSEGDVGDYTSLALDEAGNPHISYYDRSNDNLKYAYYDGSQWHIETVDSEGDVGLYTSLVLDSAGHPHISYLDYDNKVPKYAYYDGEQWHTEVVDDSNGRRGYYSSLALDNAGHPHMVYYDEMSDTAIYAHYDGSQWQIQTIDESRSKGLYASIAVDGNGYPHIAYVQGVRNEVKYAYYDGEQWQIETVTNAYAKCTSLALDNNGYPHIAYMDEGSNYHYYLEYAYYDGAQWHIQTVDSHLYTLGSCLSLSLDNARNPHIAYYVWDENDEGNNLKHSYYDGSSWHGEVVDESGSDGYLGDLSLAIDSTGHPHIAYYSYDYDSSFSGIKYAYYDGTQWRFEVVTSGSQYGNISLDLDSNDIPHIAYGDAFDESLKYAYYDGEEWNIETVENSPISDASMKLDSNDNPHIAYSYYHDNNFTLKYAYHDGSQWNIETLKNNPSIEYISLALDPSDHPHIAYYSDFSLQYAYGAEISPTPTPGATSTPATPTPTPLPPTPTPTPTPLPPTPTPTFTTTPPSPTPTPTVTPTPVSNVFSDVPDDFWAVDYINRIYNDGITHGCSAEPLQFCPSADTTRAQIAVLLLRAMHYPDEYTPPAAEATFTDTANSWAKDWIEALKAAGITQGYPDGSYRPNNPVTRAEMAVFLLRAIHGGDYSPPPVEHSRFTDVPDDYWAKDWIEELAAEEITSGYPDGTYRPVNPVSRAEMAVFLVKAFGLP